MAGHTSNPVTRIFELLKFEKEQITAVYFYALMNGIVNLTVPLGLQAIISFVMGGAISTSLVLLITFVVIGVFVNGLLQVNQIKLIEQIQQQLFVRYSFNYADKIPKLDMKAVDGYYLPEMVNRIFDTASLQKGLSKLLLDFPAAIIQIIFSLLLLCFYHPVFILFSVLLATVVATILKFTGLRRIETSRQESDFKYKVAGHLEEVANSITAFKYASQHGYHIKKADEYVTGYIKSRTAHFKILLVQYWTFIGFKLIVTAAMLIVGANLLLSQQINIGQFIASELVILTVIGYVEKIIVSLDNIYDILTSVEKLEKLTDKPSEAYGDTKMELKNGIAVQVQQLKFAYQDGHEVLNDISFKVNAGEKVCIKGKQSAGKSTLLKILGGLYHDFSGGVKLNGIPIEQCDHMQLRSNTGMMLYHRDIFKGTLWDNITMGNEQLTHEQVDELAAVVGLQEYVNKDKQGYMMPLHEAGSHLAGRIAKKILLVRALAIKPKMLLLEEPWLGLEDEHALRIQKYILGLHDTTVFVITNDDTFATQCDHLLVLEDSRQIGFINTKPTN
jgi:ATP-binding cassette, subfamily B, bacterial